MASSPPGTPPDPNAPLMQRLMTGLGNLDPMKLGQLSGQMFAQGGPRYLPSGASTPGAARPGMAGSAPYSAPSTLGMLGSAAGGLGRDATVGNLTPQQQQQLMAMLQNPQIANLIRQQLQQQAGAGVGSGDYGSMGSAGMSGGTFDYGSNRTA